MKNYVNCILYILLSLILIHFLGNISVLKCSSHYVVKRNDRHNEIIGKLSDMVSALNEIDQITKDVLETSISEQKLILNVCF